MEHGFEKWAAATALATLALVLAAEVVAIARVSVRTETAWREPTRSLTNALIARQR